MPTPAMTPKLRRAYEEALKRIEACRQEKGRVLDLRKLGLTSLPSEIGQLAALTKLYLGSNQLSSLPPEIGQLTALTELDLSFNQLSSLPPEIGQLSALTQLYLHSNQLRSLPPEIGQLSALTELALESNQLSSLPPEIGQLSALTELALESNKLRSLQPKICQLSSLTRLYLQFNQLGSLPPEIGQMSALKELVLSFNQLSSLPPEIGQLVALAELYLHDNPLLALPPSVLGPNWKECKGYGGTDDPAPPAEILDYYFSIVGGEGRALREVKVIFVGRGEVGKSSMVDALLGKKFAKGRHRTDGIAITPWAVKLPDGEAELTLWDFGGQEIMHGTHQFFMTHRSLYVVMVDGRHDRGKQDAEYWLKLARAFGGDSPMLVVMNRQKAHPFDMDREAVAKKHGVELEHFFRTDCETPATIQPLREAILAEAVRMLAAEERFPISCWQVKARLAAMKEKGEDYFSDECYEGICTENGLPDTQAQEKLLRRLADLGTIVSFPGDLKMSALSVLNPEWATDSIYRVVTDETLREVKHGLLTRKKLRDILPKDRWPKPLHVNYVMDLMEKFDLCFPVDGKPDQMLVPELLPDKTPPQGDWQPENCVVFQYNYPILPHGILPRFITRTHTLSERQDRWRTGVVLADDGAQARLQADYDNNTLTIWVRGPHADARRALLKVIRSNFDSIHARIEGLSPEEMVAVPGHPKVLVSYRDAVMDERDGDSLFKVTIDQTRVTLSLGDLLNRVESKKEREKREVSDLTEKYLGHRTISKLIIDNRTMNDDHSTNIGGNVTNSQVGQTMTNCTNMINQQATGERKDLLEELDKQVRALISALPEEKKEKIPEIEENLEMIIKQATSEKPNRKWYEVSSEGLLDASKYVKDFTGNIAAPIKSLGKLVLGAGT